MRIFGKAFRSNHPKASAFCDEPLPSNGRPKPRVLVNTQPKSGTYLVAEILRQAGFHHTYMHLGEARMQAYDPDFLDEGLANPRRFDVSCGIAESRKLIRTGDVAASHLRFSRKLEKMLSNFEIVHVRRELRSALLSWARMILYSGRSGRRFVEAIEQDGVAGLMRLKGSNAIDTALAIDRWRVCPNVASFKMEDILSEPDNCIAEMLRHVNSDCDLSPGEIWDRARSVRTLTVSTNYDRLEWTSKDEDVFNEIGGSEANRQLGYSEKGIAR